MLKLFYAPGACSLASHIALEETGAAYEAVRLDLRAGDQRKPEYQAVNPKGKVPALQTDRGVLTENPAILGYLAQTYPDARLAPVDDAYAFAAVQAFNMFLASSVHIAFNHVFRAENWTADPDGADAVRTRAKELVRTHFATLEEMIQGDWVHGDFTISDPYLYVFERWYDGMGVGVLTDDHPRLAAHRTRMQTRPATAAALTVESQKPL